MVRVPNQTDTERKLKKHLADSGIPMPRNQEEDDEGGIGDFINEATAPIRESTRNLLFGEAEKIDVLPELGVRTTEAAGGLAGPLGDLIRQSGGDFTPGVLSPPSLDPLEDTPSPFSLPGQPAPGREELTESFQERPITQQLAGGAVFGPENVLPAVGFGSDIARGLRGGARALETGGRQGAEEAVEATGRRATRQGAAASGQEQHRTFNVDKGSAPSLDEMRPGDRVTYLAYGNKRITRMLTESGEFVKPPFRGPKPGVENVRRIEEGQQVSRGKRSLINRLGLEKRLGGLEPGAAEDAQEFLRMLPDDLLENLGSSFYRDSGPFGSRDIGGFYDSGNSLVNIVKGAVDRSLDPSRVIIHEVSHHLEQFVPSDDAKKLVRQFQRDLKNRGKGVIDESNRLRGLGRRLTDEEVRKVNQAYRFEDFREWFAEVLTDKALRDIYAEVEPYKGAVRRALGAMKEFGAEVLNFLRRRRNPDVAERVYNDLLAGRFPASQRRNLSLDDPAFRELPLEDLSDDDLIRIGGGIADESSLTRRIREAGEALESATTKEQIEAAETSMNRAKQELTDAREAAIVRGRQAAGGKSETVEAAQQSFEARTGDSFDSLVDDQVMGQQFVAPLRPLEEVAEEVVTTDNPIIRNLIGKFPINPSVLRNTEIGRVVTAFQRQRVAIDDLTEAALTAANDSHFQRITGRTSQLLPVNDQGIWKGAEKHWADVFERPDKFDLTEQQRAYVNDLLKVVRETEEMRQAAGLKPLDINRDGWFFFPRKAKGSGEIEFRRPSSSHLQRVFDEATEGVARGVNYNNNPRAVLEIHLRQAYREILNEQLSSTLRPRSLTPKELLSKMKPGVVRGYEDAVENGKNIATELRRKQRQMRGLQVGRETEAAQAAGELRQARAPQRRALQQEINELKERLKEAKSARNQAKARYSAEMERIRNAETAPGNFFGANQPDRIPISLWRNRFFPRDQADELREGVETMFQPNPGSRLSRMVGFLGDNVRFLASVGDFALPLTHGLPTLFRRPDVWAKGTLRHYQAWFDPRVQGNYIRKHQQTAQKLAQHGALGAQNEFFIASQLGRGPNLSPILSRMPKGDQIQKVLRTTGRQTFGRFQSSYDTGLTSYRIGMWEALRPGWKGSEGELAQYIRNMTGGLDSRALGVGPSQRGFESMWLAFSPRLLRSTVALMGQALMQPNTPVGRESLRSLGQMASIGAGLYVTSGIGLGKSMEEIQEGLNPLNGKKFLSHEVNGNWIGIGGQVRAIAQAIGAITSSAAPGGKPIGDLASTDFVDNPMINFYMSRGAPAFNIVGGGVEATTSVDALPYDQVDGPLELVRHIGTSALPFTLQGALEGESPSASGFSVSGFRVSPETFGEARDQTARQQFGAEFDQLPPRQQDQVTQQVEQQRGETLEEAFPPDLPNADKRIDLAFQAVAKAKEDGAAHVDQVFEAGRLGKPLREAVQDTRKKVFDVSQSHFTEDVRAALDQQTDEEQSDLEVLRQRYWSAPIEENPDGTLNFDQREVVREQVLAEAEAKGIPPAHVQQRPAITDDPVVQGVFDRYDQDIETLQQYWDGSNDFVWQQLDGQQREVWDTYTSAEAAEKRRLEQENPFLTGAASFRDNVREEFRRRNPEADVALIRWGYATRPLTQEGLDMLEFMQSP